MAKTPKPSVPPSPAYFPRTSEIPLQSPKYWAKEKDRYLRQLLISDIQGITGRSLVVFFSQLSQPISHTDPDDLSEMLQGFAGKPLDLMIQTPGGNVDATEKIISVLKNSVADYRVIVPSWAKSAGTVVAISSKEILLGMNSELGPIDPSLPVNGNNVPCELIAADPAIAQHIRTMAALQAQRMRILAEGLLTAGMMQGRPKTDVDATLDKISTSAGYKSHGAVIDHTEAVSLGLTVTFLQPNDSLWRRLWLLYCLYDYDATEKRVAKIFENEKFSISRPMPVPRP